jgi:hypothetical protein
MPPVKMTPLVKAGLYFLRFYLLGLLTLLVLRFTHVL